MAKNLLSEKIVVVISYCQNGVTIAIYNIKIKDVWKYKLIITHILRKRDTTNQNWSTAYILWSKLQFYRELT